MEEDICKIDSIYLDKTFDKELNKIIGLKYLPWIGKYYSQKKFLIVGDSHYDYDDGEDNEWLKDKSATRRFINLCGLSSQNDIYEYIPILRNIEKSVYNCSQISHEKRKILWSSVSYFNLVQRLLGSRDSYDRPNDEDFDLGWEVFFKIVQILRPKYILKCGKAGEGRLGNMLTNNNPGWLYDDKEYYLNPRVMNISKDNYSFKLLFINHPSGSFGYSYEKWGEIIQQNFNNSFIN